MKIEIKPGDLFYFSILTNQNFFPFFSRLRRNPACISLVVYFCGDVFCSAFFESKFVWSTGAVLRDAVPCIDTMAAHRFAKTQHQISISSGKAEWTSKDIFARTFCALRRCSRRLSHYAQTNNWYNLRTTMPGVAKPALYMSRIS